MITQVACGKSFSQTQIRNNKTRWGEYFIPLILLCVCLFGFLPIVGLDLRLGKQVLTEWCLFFIGVSLFLKNRHLKWLLIIIFTRYILMFFYPIYQGHVNTICIKSAYSVIYTLLITFIAFDGVTTNAKLNKNAIFSALCVLGCVQTAFMMLQWFGVWIWFVPLDRGFAGLFSNPNMAGSFLAIITPCYMRKKWIYVFPFIFFGIYLSDTMGALIPVSIFIIAYPFIFLKNNHIKKVYIALSVFLSIVAVSVFIKYGNLSSFNLRLSIWGKAIIQTFRNVPFVGYGVGSFKILFPKISKEVYGYGGANGWAIQAHNEYIQALFELGIIGMVPIVLFLKRIIQKAFQMKEWLLLSGVLIALLNASVNFLFHTVVCIVFLLYCSIIEKGKVSYE